MNDLTEFTFLRKYAVNFRKSLSFPLGKMDFSADFVNKSGGDPYPVLQRQGNPAEKVEKGVYSVRGEKPFVLTRIMGSFFPFATYEMNLNTAKNVYRGFTFFFFEQQAPAVTILCNDTEVKCTCTGGETKVFPLVGADPLTLVVTARGMDFDIYVSRIFVGTYRAECFGNITQYEMFSRCKAAISVQSEGYGEAVLNYAGQYLDSGIAQADIRPIRYEDGTPIIENGRLFFTLSTRGEAGGYQGVVSVTPTGCDWRLEGALFFDCGDGMWANDIAASVLFDRNREEYLIWFCSFRHGHILGWGTSKSDVKHGVNVIDATLMEPAPQGENYTAFQAFEGDEDPDFYYDKEKDEWVLAICRFVDDGEEKRYKYVRFVSQNPFTGYRFTHRTYGGSDTGGSFVKVGAKRFFVCGSTGEEPARYKCYPADDFSRFEYLKYDYPDGGFRGWGTVVAVPVGNRLLCQHYTFDRMRGSDFTWSYGNLYCFEADKFLRPHRTIQFAHLA